MAPLHLRKRLAHSSCTCQLEVTPSCLWEKHNLLHLETLTQHRNQYVCKQLVTMVKEQLSKVEEAVSAGDQAALCDAGLTFLATLSCDSNNCVLAAAVFYPRSSSKDGIAMPHMYVELLCCNTPGNGLGRLLLQHIEQFVADNCDAISQTYFRTPAAEIQHAVPKIDVDDRCLSTDTVVAGGTSMSHENRLAASQQQQGAQATAVQQYSHSMLPVVLSTNTATPAASTSSTAASKLSEMGSSHSLLNGMLDDLCSRNARSRESSPSSKSKLTEAVLNNWHSAEHPWQTSSAHQAEPLSHSKTCHCQSNSHDAAAQTSESNPPEQEGGAHKPQATVCSMLCHHCNLIQGIKLLSVQSAQGFYTKCGYGVPDSCSEMYKPLSAMQRSMQTSMTHQPAF